MLNAYRKGTSFRTSLPYSLVHGRLDCTRKLLGNHLNVRSEKITSKRARDGYWNTPIAASAVGAEPMDKINPGKVKSHEGGSRLVLERELLRCEKRELNPNSILDLEAVSGVLGSVGVPDRHLRTLYGDLFRRGVRDLNKISDVGKKARSVLLDNFVLCTSSVVEVKRQEEGKGAKLVVKLQDGMLVETVIINHRHESSGRERNTVCVSSQVGCGMGCKFCATGTMGLRANLTAGEILEQVWHCRELVGRVDNVVFMGMGEPLDNYDEVLIALKGLSHQTMFDLGLDKLTISTVGVTDKIRQLAHDCPKANLALSLHAANQAVRESIVPTASINTMDKLGDALTYYHHHSSRKVMMEYIVIGLLNDSETHACDLGEFCTGRDCIVNLIPYNPTEVGAKWGYQVPSDEAVRAFANVISDEYGLQVKVRWSSAGGREVDGACGQLVIKQPMTTEKVHLVK